MGSERSGIALRVLGPLELASSELRSSRVRRLLAALATRPNAVVSVDWLADVVWGNVPPAHTGAALHTLVSRLRPVLARASLHSTGSGPPLTLVTRAPGYLLEVDPNSVDALRFERLAVPARSRLEDDPAESMRLLDEALALWRGPAYAEFAQEDFARPEAARLEELRANAVEDRIEASLRLGGHIDVIAQLESLTAAAPLREKLHKQLMLADYRAGRQAEALELYREFRDRLDEQLGLEPSPPMRRLQSDILRHSPTLDWRPPPTALVATAGPTDDTWPRGNVVETTGHLFGREEDLAGLTARLSAGSVLTLTGPGGVGKTSLATRAASRLAPRFSSGAWLCELAAVSDPEAAGAALATALDVPARRDVDPTGRLVAYLNDKQVLLVLDNCEHLLESVASLVHELHRQCPGLAVLATSRTPLEVEDEQLWPLGPLPVPSSSDPNSIAGSPAVQLFVTRASAQAPDFALDNANSADISEICRRLDGLPLAIELAATRMRAMSPADLAARLSWRFRLLRGGVRTATERHRTLRSVVDWSFQLLDPLEQHVFEVLSVFAGSFTVQAAERLVAAVEPPEMALDEIDAADVVLRLVDRSMVVRLPGSVTQYGLLETMREYGRERLAGQRLNRLRRAHAEQFARLVASTAQDIFGPQHLSDVRDLELHFDELRAAHRWGLVHDIAVSAELVGGLTLYVEHTMSAEVMEWAHQTLEAATAAKVPALSGVLAVAAAAARFQGALADAEGLVAEGLARGAPPATEGYLRYMLVDVSLLDGRIDDASRHVGELLALAEREGLTSLARMVGLTWQFVVAYDGDPRTAVAAAERIQVDAEASGETIIANWAVHVQGEALIDTDPVRAGALLEDALRRARESGDRYLQGVALVAAASVRTRHGDPADAAPLFLAVVDHWRDSGIWTQQWTTLRNVVDLLVRLHRDQPAAVLLGALSSRRTSAAVFGADTERMAAELEMLTERLGSEAFGALHDQGATMDDDEVVAVARRALAHLVSAAGGRSGRS